MDNQRKQTTDKLTQLLQKHTAAFTLESDQPPLQTSKHKRHVIIKEKHEVYDTGIFKH